MCTEGAGGTQSVCVSERQRVRLCEWLHTHSGFGGRQAG